MADGTRSPRGVGRAVAALAVASTLVGCAAGPAGGPAPVIMKFGSGADVAAGNQSFAGAPGRIAAPPSAVARPKFQRVTVQHGETLHSLARALHVTERVIIEANRLRPPFQLEPGSTLLVPEGPRGVASGEAYERVALTAPPAVAVPPLAAVPPSAPSPAAHVAPQVSVQSVPLTPPPTAPATPAPLSSQSSAAGSQRATAGRAEPTNPEAAETHGGRFAWPVRGRILAGYGAAAGGGRNDGINIGAPRGAPVQAIDAGVVAYAGNELRGYGNLVLIKQPNGWISAYAHCEALLVKKGEKVTRGEIIARVGSSGGVSEPQLHFELRHGNHAVDPREFLAPLPSAGGELGSGEG